MKVRYHISGEYCLQHNFVLIDIGVLTSLRMRHLALQSYHLVTKGNVFLSVFVDWIVDPLMHLVQWCSLQCSMQNLRKTITTQCLCKRQINSPIYCKEIHLFRPSFLVLPSHVKMKDAIFESTRWSAGDSFDLNLRAGCLSEPSQNQMSEIISNSSSFPKSFITDILNIFFYFH